MHHDPKKLHARSVELLKDVQAIEAERATAGVSSFHVNDLASRGANLIQSAVGPKSVYLENIRNAQKQSTTVGRFLSVAGVLQGFHKDLANGHLINIRQEVEAVVVSEILTQARKLSKTKGVHSAPVVMVACAGVEEFLRNWCDIKELKIPEKQRSISKFAAELRAAGHISLPVERRIQSWADYRNDAAHGANWSKITPEIADRVVKEIEDFILESREILG